jgi:hypothetical protein
MHLVAPSGVRARFKWAEFDKNIATALPDCDNAAA